MYNLKGSTFVFVLVVLGATSDVLAWKTRRTTTPRFTTTTSAEETTPSSQEDTARDVAEGSQNGADSTVTRLIGNDVKTKPYDPMLYDGQSGGPIKTSDDLECKAGQVCCWANSDKSSSTTIKWQSGKGLADPAKFQANFDSQKPPDEIYLVAYTDSKRGSTERALFESCSIVCAEGPIDVTFRYWTTPGVSLQVCTRDAFFGDADELNNCRNVQTNHKQSGQANVTVPVGEFVAIDLVASSFTSETGGAAIIDHINVLFKPCPGGSHSTKPPVATTRGPTRNTSADDDQTTNCPSLECTFEQDLCAYKEYKLVRATPNQQAKGFAVRRGRFENLLTGAVAPKDNGAYAAAYFYPQDSASLQSGPLNLSSTRIFRFRGYVATQGLRLKVCIDTDINCPLITSSDVRVADRRRWKTYNLVLPKGTKQVFITAENTGTNQGAVGIDNIELFRPLSTGPLDAEQPEGPACVSTRARNL